MNKEEEIENNTDNNNTVNNNTVNNNIDKHNKMINFLNKASIVCNNINDLNGMLIPREIFMNEERYKNIKEDIPELKKIFSSSYLTSLQETAQDKQRWPLLNLIRQLLRSCNYKLTPKRVSDGYTLDGKKKYKRMFIVEKMRVIL
jgi:hypothetical protein